MFSMMSIKLTAPPQKNPSNEISRMVEFFSQHHTEIPLTELWARVNSQTDGITKVLNVLQTDPIKAKSSAKSGIIMPMT
jgi:hypothetical protein